MPKLRYLVVVFICTFMLVGCGGSDSDDSSVAGSSGSDSLEYADVITADEVGAYYGFSESGEGDESEVQGDILPIRMVVRESHLEGNSMATATVFSNEGVWIGEISVGTIVNVSAISLDGNWCLAEGTTLGGWNSKGWVLCYRLREQE